MADESIETKEELVQVKYTEENIRTLSDMEHVRTRPGMYIGKLGDGSFPGGRYLCTAEGKLSTTPSMNSK